MEIPSRNADGRDTKVFSRSFVPFLSVYPFYFARVVLRIKRSVIFFLFERLPLNRHGRKSSLFFCEDLFSFFKSAVVGGSTCASAAVGVLFDYYLFACGSIAHSN